MSSTFRVHSLPARAWCCFCRCRWDFPFHSCGVSDVNIYDSQFQRERQQVLMDLRDRRARNFRARLFHHSADSEDDDSDSDGVERLQGEFVG